MTSFSERLLGRRFNETVMARRSAFRPQPPAPAINRQGVRRVTIQSAVKRAEVDLEPPPFPLRLEGGDRFGRFGRLAA